MCSMALFACLGDRPGLILSKIQDYLGLQKRMEKVWMTQCKSAPLGKQSLKTLCMYGLVGTQKLSWSMSETRLGKSHITHYLALCTFVEEKELLLHPPAGKIIKRTLLAPPSIALTYCLHPFSEKQGGRMTHWLVRSCPKSLLLVAFLLW